MSVGALAAVAAIVTCILGLVLQVIFVTRWFTKLEAKIDQHSATTVLQFGHLGDRVERVETTLQNGSIIVLDPRKHVRIELDPHKETT